MIVQAAAGFQPVVNHGFSFQLKLSKLKAYKMLTTSYATLNSW
jgi:hypothetical protein